MKKHLLILACAAWLAAPASAVIIDWVSVGDPGNACDTQPQRCFGAVADTYRISKTEVTNAQYAEFLNAVEARDGAPVPLCQSGARGVRAHAGRLA